MEATAVKKIHSFKRGDKVIHHLSVDDEMVGTVSSVLGDDRYLVEFFISGRRRGGYMTEIEFSGAELEPCFIDIEATKRHSA